MGGEVFTPTFNYHVPCKGGGGEGELQKERSATREENQDT